MTPPLAYAYANQARWIADCPRPYCGSAERLTAWQPQFACSRCGATTPLEWPPDAREISAVLAARGAPQWQNWFPAGHPLALAAGCPHGQTVTDLIGENAGHAAEMAAWNSLGPGRQQLAELMGAI